LKYSTSQNPVGTSGFVRSCHFAFGSPPFSPACHPRRESIAPAASAIPPGHPSLPKRAKIQRVRKRTPGERLGGTSRADETGASPVVCPSRASRGVRCPPGFLITGAEAKSANFGGPATRERHTVMLRADLPVRSAESPLRRDRSRGSARLTQARRKHTRAGPQRGSRVPMRWMDPPARGGDCGGP
jgi:hypothetical protein